MNENIRLGRVGGIAVGLNWSVLVIFALVVWALAAVRFPLVFPEISRTWHIVGGLVAGTLFFLSLLAHEISHALVARRNGVGVEGITLWMFGGVARLEGEASDPGAEFRIAVVGPAVSVAIGAVCLALAAVAENAGLIGDAVIVEGILRWLGIINIVLAVFNLMPAAPLDGGRILKSVLWRWRGDRLRAAAKAAGAGKVFGFILVGLGLLQFFTTETVGGLWLAFIGWFLVMAASAEQQHALMRRALADVRVGDVMSRDPVTVPTDMTVVEFIDRYVFEHRFSGYPVVDDGDVRGLVTVNRVKAVPSERRADVRLEEIMTPAHDVATGHPDDSLADLIERMSPRGDGRAVVIDRGRLVGIVSPTDVVKRLELSELAGDRQVHGDRLGAARRDEDAERSDAAPRS